MKTVNHTVTVQNKRHSYSLSQKRGGVVRIVCKSANINQDFLAEDVPALLIDLPNLIVAEKNYGGQTNVVRFRISSSDKSKIERKAVKAGFDSMSDYLRHLALTH